MIPSCCTGLTRDRGLGEHAAAPVAKLDEAVQLGRLEVDRARLSEEVDRLRRERDQARREATEERDRLLGLVEATQKLLEDQSRQRKPKRSWWPLFHDE